ncbi:hypothetical protein [Pedobacter rhodius]|uniref:Uncharacterized protein n=1 Tax=Pedobacter rhodius TaxID=3004098 RepID=A0ABT4L0W9_9SPHI|nr:hypothetical protein [Pedobacter sp. SJ11]MCZ4224827.1 hypothetical protein [Pedobacter sp. SJ11]
MLKNELQYIEEILFAPETFCTDAISEIDIGWQCKLIRQAWEKAIFSDISEHSLVRYFHYHLDGLTKLLDGLSLYDYGDNLKNIEEALLALIDRIKSFYSTYFNPDAYAPAAYHQRLIGQLTGSIGLIKENLQTAMLSSELKTCLFNWLSEMTEVGDDIRYSFRSLGYLEELIRQIPSIDFCSGKAEEILVAILCRSNFNYLSFFVYRQNYIREVLVSFTSAQERLDYLQEQRANVLSCPEAKKLGYDTSWPSLKIMLGEWLQEEICLTEQALRRENEIRAETNVPKLPIEMSVAHMACLIRLLFEESVFATNNLKLIFKCFAGHYQTKRQSVISPGSLSKEFYSIDQHTAARVRDLLQKMVQRINRNFFPVLVVINAIILSCSDKR